MRNLLYWALIRFNRQPLYKTGQLFSMNGEDVTAVHGRKWLKHRKAWAYRIDYNGGQDYVPESHLTRLLKEHGDLGCL